MMSEAHREHSECSERSITSREKYRQEVSFSVLGKPFSLTRSAVLTLDCKEANFLSIMFLKPL